MSDWVSYNGALSQSEMENNATIIYNTLYGLGYSLDAISAICGNIQAESSFSPVRTETSGGGGYGLIQWTPVDTLQAECSTLGISPYTDGDVQVSVINAELNGSISGYWFITSTTVSNYATSGATSAMVGTSGSEFISNSKGFTLDDLTVVYMIGRERPTEEPSGNHYTYRQECAAAWYEFFSGVTPTPTPTVGAAKKWVIYLGRKL